MYILYWIVDSFSEFLESYNTVKWLLTSLITCHEDMASLGGGNSVAQ